MIRMPNYKYKKEEERDRIRRMEKFKECIKVTHNLTDEGDDALQGEGGSFDEVLESYPMELDDVDDKM